VLAGVSARAGLEISGDAAIANVSANAPTISIGFIGGLLAIPSRDGRTILTDCR
jgi:hypothetical protein